MKDDIKVVHKARIFMESGISLKLSGNQRSLWDARSLTKVSRELPC